MAYPDCRWCQGVGCISCEDERRKDAETTPQQQGAINVHLQSPRQLREYREQIIHQTGQEPVICLHLYATSMEDLQEAFRIESPGEKRRVSKLEKLFAQAETGVVKINGVEELLESEELRNARMMRDKWSQHGTQYARDQAAFYDREIERLLTDQNRPAAPADNLRDADEEEVEAEDDRK